MSNTEEVFIDLDKEDLKRIKLIFSSAFTRKPKYYIMDLDNNKILTTTIDIFNVNMFTYKPHINDVFHELNFKSDYFQFFTDKFPIFKSNLFTIDIKAFSSFINKNKSKKAIIELNDKANKLKAKQPDGKAVTIGFLQDKEQYGLMTEVLDRYRNESKDTIPHDFDESYVNNGSVVFYPISVKKLNIENPIFNTDYKFHIPIADGFSILSVREYIKKTNIEHTFKLYGWCERNCIKTMFVYEDEHIKVFSIKPCSRLFPKLVGES